MSKPGKPSQRMLDNISIVLLEPKYPENIGAAARCAMNMGISRLIVVRAEAPDQEKMLKMATHKAAGLIQGLKLLEEAVDKSHGQADIRYHLA